MSELSQSDLILAGGYIDGELSDEQCAVVESRLKTDAEFSKAVVELQRQSSILKRLPKFRPSEELADQTLQASIDQVQAIMGKWPFESSSNEDGKVLLEHSADGDSADGDSANWTSANRDSVNGDSFNWRSFAALAATLAGVLFLGAMLWPKQDLGTNVAMSPETEVGRNDDGIIAAAPAADLAMRDSGTVKTDVRSADEGLAEEGLSEEGLVMKGKSPPSMKGGVSESDVASKLPPMRSGFSGTRMRVGKPQDASPGSAVAVDQVWFVNQPGATPDVAAINKVLASNSIAFKPAADSVGSGFGVGGGLQASSATNDSQDSSSDVEAFYVAATPGQMKLALTQLSNNADISMFEVPQNGLQIADAAERQFQKSMPLAAAESVKQQAMPEPDSNVQLESMPNRIESPGTTNALAQQLVNRSLPRNSMPSGPVPPILESGMEFADGAEMDGSTDDAADSASEVAGLDKSKKPDFARPSPEKSKPAITSKRANAMAQADTPSQDPTVPANAVPANAAVPSASSAQMGMGMGVGGNNQQGTGVVDPNSTAYFDRHLDDSDKQLRQYLILIRGDASATAKSKSTPAKAAGQR